jgi:ATP-dependent DNA helicase HFM1/MER3
MHSPLKVYELIHTFSSGRPTLVFCGSRQGTKRLAHQLKVQSSNGAEFEGDNDKRTHLRKVSASIQDSELQHLVSCGIGFHNAAVSDSDRAIIEKLFLEGNLLIICTRQNVLETATEAITRCSGYIWALSTTSTLALGVNLPAHCVIVKSTQVWEGPKNGYVGMRSFLNLELKLKKY